MSKRRHKRTRSAPLPQNRSGEGRQRQPYVKAAVGMISIKTIRTPEGKVILHQGERISERILAENHPDDVFDEILANAMPGRKPER